MMKEKIERLIILAISLSVFLSGCSLPGLSGPAKIQLQ